MSDVSKPMIVWLVIAMAMVMAASGLHPAAQNTLFSHASSANIEAA